MDQMEVDTFLFHGAWQLVCLFTSGGEAYGPWVFVRRCSTYCPGTPPLRGALVGVGFLEFFLWFPMIKGILTLITDVAQFIAAGPSFAV